LKNLCHCEEGALPDEAISNYEEIASGKEQERPCKDINTRVQNPLDISAACLR
jgi:hypothetical protein